MAGSYEALMEKVVEAILMSNSIVASMVTNSAIIVNNKLSAQIRADKNLKELSPKELRDYLQALEAGQSLLINARDLALGEGDTDEIPEIRFHITVDHSDDIRIRDSGTHEKK